MESHRLKLCPVLEGSQMYLSSSMEEECCGCGACAAICPKECISLQDNKMGFILPRVNTDSCINCGRCKGVCPFEITRVEEKVHNHQARFVFAADSGYRNSSGSGGAFGKLAEQVASDYPGRYAIFGAAFTDGFKVRHVCATNLDQLGPIRGSKYIQSDTKDVFKAVQAMLNENCFVLFSGTPCQVAALRRYLQAIGDIHSENLLLVDLVCHGVPSQKCFDNYVRCEEQRYGSKVEEVKFHFRETTMGETPDSRRMRLTFSDGRSVVYNRNTGSFLRMYHGDYGYRESCYSCPYARRDREGDLTLKDAWSVKQYYPEFDAHEGVSLVLSNTNKGDKWLGLILEREDVIERPVDYEAFIQTAVRGTLAKPTSRPEKNEAFMDALKRVDFNTASKRFCRPPIISRLKMSVKRLLHL